MTPRLYLVAFRVLGVLNVALAIAVLARAPRLAQVALASLTCGIALWVTSHELVNVILTCRRRRRGPHLVQRRNRGQN